MKLRLKKINLIMIRFFIIFFINNYMKIDIAKTERGMKIFQQEQLKLNEE